MSLIMLSLMLLAVGIGGAIVYGGYRMYRSAAIEDEAEERERLAKEAARIEELEKLYPGVGATMNREKAKKFLKRT